MTQGKGKRDEKLIEELYEKLYWYTYDCHLYTSDAADD